MPQILILNYPFLASIISRISLKISKTEDLISNFATAQVLNSVYVYAAFFVVTNTKIDYWLKQNSSEISVIGCSFQ